MAKSSVKQSIPVVDVDQTFPTMIGGSIRESAAAPGIVDTGTPVRAAIRDILGSRPRPEDPKAFVDALRSSFRLSVVEGHIETEYVPRGYAVQSDLGAVTGGQASFYRRAQLVRTEVLRILDALVPLRVDSDSQDVDAYRGLIRGAVQSLVDELGAAGGSRREMVDAYFQGLTGTDRPELLGSADGVGGQLGALRDRLGLIDDNVNTVEEEGIRTSYWTLVDMVTDLQKSWIAQRDRFSGVGGFLGTDLIKLSRLMEAAADQVDELEAVLDSVLVPLTERRTIVLNSETGLTLDGLLSWLRDFLSTEGRRVAQDGGRDGIVSALTPTAIALLTNFKNSLGDQLAPDFGRKGSAAAQSGLQIHYLPTSSCEHKFPTGMYAARTRIAVASLARLLMELARTAQRIGRWSRVVLLDVTITRLFHQEQAAEVQVRGLNLRRHYIPAFLPPDWAPPEGANVHDFSTNGVLKPLRGSSTADGESITGIFHLDDLKGVIPTGAEELLRSGGVLLPAEEVRLAIIDGETGTLVYAPTPKTWPAQRAAADPLSLKAEDLSNSWDLLPRDEQLRRDPELIVDPSLDDELTTFLKAADLAGRYLVAKGQLHDLQARQRELSEITTNWPGRDRNLKERFDQAEKEIQDRSWYIGERTAELAEEQDPALQETLREAIASEEAGRDAAQLRATETQIERAGALKVKNRADKEAKQIQRRIDKKKHKIQQLQTDTISKLASSSAASRSHK